MILCRAFLESQDGFFPLIQSRDLEFFMDRYHIESSNTRPVSVCNFFPFVLDFSLIGFLGQLGPKYDHEIEQRQIEMAEQLKGLGLSDIL